jgi:hypothetical protein
MRSVVTTKDSVVDLLSMRVMLLAITVLTVDSNAVGNLAGTLAKR